MFAIANCWTIIFCQIIWVSVILTQVQFSYQVHSQNMYVWVLVNNINKRSEYFCEDSNIKQFKQLYSSDRIKNNRTTMVHRTESECSDFSDLEIAGVEPLTLEDITFNTSYVNTDLRWN